MATWAYREIAGRVKSVCISEKPKLRGTPDFAKRSFHQNILDAYKQVEETGNWQGAYPKGFVKRVHENALAEGRK